MKQSPKRTSRAPNKDNLVLADDIKPLREVQRMFLESYAQGANVVAYGSAGTGKSFLACYVGLKDLFDREVNKIVIVRSAVQTRDQGFLPGSLDEKTAVYTIPYKNIVNDLCNNGTAWDILTKKQSIEFMTTSYIRGITLDDCVLIIDEVQNFDQEELESTLTRVGENCRVIVCGDTRQNDLKRRREKSGFDWLIRIATKMPDWFDMVEFFPEDIVRSDFVKALIMAIEDDTGS